MTVWALNNPGSSKRAEFVSASLCYGYSRFGWSYYDSADLEGLKNKAADGVPLNKDEAITWSKCRFLLGLQPGDWVVHINVPSWGRCMAAKVVGPYTFEADASENPIQDFRHRIPVDPNSVIEFGRNDEGVHPAVSRRLKLQGKAWRITLEQEFLTSLDNVKSGKVALQGMSPGMFYLKKELSRPLKELTALIQRNHESKKLEALLADVFREVQGVEKVEENGSGWGTDHGADLLVTYRSGFPVDGLETQKLLVVQVKSYVGEHHELGAVEQLKTGIAHYQADEGLLVTMAESTEHLEEALDQLATELEKPVSLLAGGDVARFILKHYGAKLL